MESLLVVDPEERRQEGDSRLPLAIVLLLTVLVASSLLFF